MRGCGVPGSCGVADCSLNKVSAPLVLDYAISVNLPSLPLPLLGKAGIRCKYHVTSAKPRNIRLTSWDAEGRNWRPGSGESRGSRLGGEGPRAKVKDVTKVG
ncbi:hypothetical protein E2C01_086232 [Portunus trituberculatus]|uniref:Uncharacterized protein n=1 Tax=Portunus trituberculatus TaxID=210409 RepID=A0A5B7J4W7_PORTR|nr:hypothetical protein [Portunus trituberculatus]